MLMVYLLAFSIGETLFSGLFGLVGFTFIQKREKITFVEHSV